MLCFDQKVRTMASALFVAVDTWSDVVTSVIFFSTGHYIFGGIALTVVVLSAAFSGYAAAQECLDGYAPGGHVARYASGRHVVGLLGVLGLGPVYFACSKKTDEAATEVVQRLRCVECCMKAIPQAMLQIYVLLIAYLDGSSDEYSHLEFAWIWFSMMMSMSSLSFVAATLRISGEPIGKDLAMFEMRDSSWPLKAVAFLQTALEITARAATTALFLAAFKGAALIALAGHVVVVAGAAYAASSAPRAGDHVLVMVLTAPLSLVVSYMPREVNAWVCVEVLLLHAAESGLMLCLPSVAELRLSNSTALAGDEDIFVGTCTAGQESKLDRCIPEWCFIALGGIWGVAWALLTALQCVKGRVSAMVHGSMA